MYLMGYDDSLDVVAVHGVGGLVGMLLIGLFATLGVNAQGANGLFYGGGFDQLWRQAVATFAVLGYSLVVTLIIAWVMHKTMGLRVRRESEVDGIDEAEHAEGAYDLVGSAGHRAGTLQHAPTRTAELDV
jgi:Amt family ammonium transporter